MSGICKTVIPQRARPNHQSFARCMAGVVEDRGPMACSTHAEPWTGATAVSHDIGQGKVVDSSHSRRLGAGPDGQVGGMMASVGLHSGGLTQRWQMARRCRHGSGGRARRTQ